MAFVSNGVTMLNAGALVASAGNQIFISSQTASNSASVSFTSGLTSTYKAYKFVFSNIHPRTDSVSFTFNLSTDSGSNYNVTKTTTAFRAIHNEANSSTGLGYETSLDLAQSTAFQPIASEVGFDADQALNGNISLFNPASTTYVKHYISTISNILALDYSENFFSAGYGNTTSAVNAIQFKMSSGNFDGTIALYGIKT